MRSLPDDRPTDYRLRFVFDERVVSVDLSPDATYGDIARTLDALSRRQYGAPVAIDVTLSAPPPAGFEPFRNQSWSSAPDARVLRTAAIEPNREG